MGSFQTLSTKICKDCGEDKPLTDYYVEKRGRDGRKGQCKSCHLAYSRAVRKRMAAAGLYGKCKNCGVSFNAYAERKTSLCRDCHKGNLSNLWKGGYVKPDGYRAIHIGNNKFTYEHRLVMERHLG